MRSRSILFLIILCMAVALPLQLVAQKKYLYEEPQTTEPEVKDDPVERMIEQATAAEDTPTLAAELAPMPTYAPLSVYADTVAHWKGLKEFAYARYLDSLLRNRKLSQEELQKKAEEKRRAAKKKSGDQKDNDGSYELPTGNGLIDSPVLKLLFWILAIGFLCFIVYSLFLKDGVFRKRSTVSPTANAKDAGVFDLQTPLSEIDRKIQEAVQQQNYRLAIRYQYIKNLHQLFHKQWATYAVDKTNFQYVQEISNADLREGFAQLTLHYEYVWYGEFAIDLDIYRELEKQFTHFYAKI
jgi:hypothetical protein